MTGPTSSIQELANLLMTASSVERSQLEERDCQLLQGDLAEWEKRCNILSCTRVRKPIIFDYKLKGHTLEYSTNSRYLGVDIVNDLNWKHHIDWITN